MTNKQIQNHFADEPIQNTDPATHGGTSMNTEKSENTGNSPKCNPVSKWFLIGSIVALLCFVAFALLPLIQAMVPLEEVNTLVNESTLAPMFNSTNLILSIMNGRL